MPAKKKWVMPEREGWGRDFTALPQDTQATDPEWRHKLARDYRSRGLSDADMHNVLRATGLSQNKQGNWVKGGGASLKEAKAALAAVHKLPPSKKKGK